MPLLAAVLGITKISTTFDLTFRLSPFLLAKLEMIRRSLQFLRLSLYEKVFQVHALRPICN